ncbi:MAG: thioredoxin [Candidatus Ornithomonoglobus sp.]
MAELKITKNNFENEVLKSDIPVLIDFWAAWCGPCRMMSPVVAELADEYEGKAKICKVNVDEEPELAVAFKVMSIPMFAVIKNGQVTDSLIGARPKEDLEVLLKC